MNKDNQFKSSNFFMSKGDILHMIIIDEAGVPMTVDLQTTPTPGEVINVVPGQAVAKAATEITSSSFTANWNLMENATGYYLDVATDSAFANYVSGWQNEDIGNTVSDSIIGLGFGSPYSYRVRAYNDIGTGTNSETVTITIPNIDCDISNYSWAQVGDLLWLTENWKCPVFNSRVYDDLEINRNIYGGLYTYDMTQVPGFIPDGCRLPTLEDVVYTMNYLGGAGFNPFNKFKEIGNLYWVNDIGTDDYGVSFRGSGIFDEPREGFQFIYSQIKEGMWFWIKWNTPGDSNVIKVNYLNGEIASLVYTMYDTMISVRFVKDVI